MNKPEEAPLPTDHSGDMEPKQSTSAILLQKVLSLWRCWLPVSQLAANARTRIPTKSEKTDPLQQSFGLLQAQQEGLAGLGKLVEFQFLAISSGLEQLPPASESLTAHSERLMLLASGSAQGRSVLEETLELLRGPLSYVEEHHTTTLHLLTVVEKAAAQIERMLATEQALQRTVAPLKFIRTMYRVESAGLDVSYQQMFQSLTDQIQNLQLQVNETFSSRFEGLRANRTTIQNLIQRLRQENTTQAAHMQRKRQELDSVIRELRANLEAEQQKNAELTAVTKVIAKQVGNLVFSLQAQDVISQKVAHILEAFTDMGATLNTHRTATSEEAKAAALQYLNQAVGVEAAQLRAVADNLNDTEDALSLSLHDVLDHISHIRKAHHASSGSRASHEIESSLVQTLLTSLSDVQSMMQTAAASAQTAFEAVKPIGGQASNVTETMRSLSAQIKLIALNAQVQAALIESGTGLEVLAAQTGVIAVETACISEGVGSELDQFSGHLNELVEAFSSLNQRGIDLQTHWKQVSTEQNDLLHSYETDLRSERDLLVQCATRIEKLAGSMRSEVGLKKIASEWVIRPAETLDSIHQMLTRDPSHTLITSAAVQYKRAYTMESERQVLDKIVSGAGSESGDNPLSATPDSAAESKRKALVGATQSTSELILFDDSTDASEPKAVESLGPTELAASNASQPPKPAEPAPKGVAAGDIELF